GSRMWESMLGPETNTRPSGSRWGHGYSGGVHGAMNSGLQPDGTWKPSTARFVEPVSDRPENVMVPPSASVVFVGYHRPCAMSCTWMSFSVSGSKMVVVFSPRKGSYGSAPPTTRARPSGKNDSPLQKRSQGTFCTLVPPVAGSNTATL